MSFKLYDEDAILVEQMADTSSFTNLCTNVFRLYHKFQQTFLSSVVPQFFGKQTEPVEIELALIPMPSVVWDAYLEKAQELSNASGQDVGCEELMLRVLIGAAPAVQQAPETTSGLRKAVGD